MSNKWTRNQKILAIGLGISAFAVIVSISMLFVQVFGLKQKIQPIIEMKPQIVNVINNTLEVKKEIANLNETIKQMYDAWDGDSFRKEDIGKRFMVFKKVGGGSIIYFQLTSGPISKSVFVSSNIGMVSPAIYDVVDNIVIVRVNTEPNQEFAGGEDFVRITYWKDSFSKQPLRTVIGMEYQGTSENVNAAKIPLLKK